MKSALMAVVVGVGFFSQVLSARAQTYALSGAGNALWGDTNSWTPQTVPNAIGASALFNSPTVTGRNAIIDSQFTVGSVTFHSTSPTGGASFITNISNFNAFPSSDLLTFNEVGAGPAMITASGPGDDNSRIQANMYFEDNVVANVTNIVGNSAAGALTLSGNINGPGGLTKTGDGMMTMALVPGTNLGDADAQIKAWQGPTHVNGGRWRTSAGGANGMQTSSFTVNGGQLTPINSAAAASTFTFGPGPLKLNGNGATSGPFGGFEGAIRPDRVTGSNSYTITNSVILESPTMVHMQGFAVDDLSQTLQFNGIISGGSVASLQISGLNSDQNLGRVVFTNTNTYEGDTIINGGRLEVSGANATFGVGDIIVNNPALVLTNGAGIAAAISRLVIPTGVSNAIGDTATVFLGGSSRGIADLAAGVVETVGAINFNGMLITAAGDYSDATHPDFFDGTGIFRILAPTGQDGDHNGDGLVDAADYVAWRKLPGDFGGDPGGYNEWRENFGEGGGGGRASGGIPEPTTLMLLGLLALFALTGRQSRT